MTRTVYDITTGRYREVGDEVPLVYHTVQSVACDRCGQCSTYSYPQTFAAPPGRCACGGSFRIRQAVGHVQIPPRFGASA